MFIQTQEGARMQYCSGQNKYKTQFFFSGINFQIQIQIPTLPGIIFVFVLYGPQYFNPLLILLLKDQYFWPIKGWGPIPGFEWLSKIFFSGIN